jgi:hypothetical protein
LFFVLGSWFLVLGSWFFVYPVKCEARAYFTGFFVPGLSGESQGRNSPDILLSVFNLPVWLLSEVDKFI